MRQMDASLIKQDELKHIFLLFGIWSFITLCRPQDYIPILAMLRPSLTFGLITLAVYFLHVQNRKSIINNIQFKLYLTLILVMIFGVPFSYYRSASLREVSDYMTVGLSFFFLFYQIANSLKRLRQLLFAYCCGASIYAVYILVFGSLSDDRIAFGNMFDPNDTAYFILNFIPFNFLFLSKKNRMLIRILIIANMILGLIVLFKTGSRGGFVACIAVFTYLLFVRMRTINISFFKKSIVICIALLALLPLSMNTERYKTILDVESDYNVTDETGRLAIWKVGIRLMLSNPLTGVGMGRFYEGVGRDRQQRGLPSAKWQGAHSSFVQIGAEIGVFGLMLYIFMSCNVFNITGRIINRSQSEDLVKISEMVRVGFLGHLVCAIFLGQAYSIYWVFYIALSAKLHRMVEEELA